jgi:hypothetical protein
MQKMDIDTVDMPAVMRIIERRKWWRRFWQRVKRFFVRKKRTMRYHRWQSSESMHQAIAYEQIRRSQLWRQDLMLIEQQYSIRHKATGELRVSSLSNPGISIDLTEMPTLRETEAIKIKDLQF